MPLDGYKVYHGIPPFQTRPFILLDIFVYTRLSTHWIPHITFHRSWMMFFLVFNFPFLRKWTRHCIPIIFIISHCIPLWKSMNKSSYWVLFMVDHCKSLFLNATYYNFIWFPMLDCKSNPFCFRQTVCKRSQLVGEFDYSAANCSAQSL